MRVIQTSSEREGGGSLDLLTLHVSNSMCVCVLSRCVRVRVQAEVLSVMRA